MLQDLLNRVIRVAYAQEPPPAVSTRALTDPLGGRFQQLSHVLNAAVNIVFYVGIALTLLFLILGGARYIVSGGDKAGTEAARGMITNAVIGFIVVLGAFALKIIIQKLLGATIPEAVWF